MAQRKPEDKVTIAQVLKLFDQLSPEEQAELRQTFIEDQEDIHTAQERLEHPGKRWSHQEIKQELGLAD